MNFIICGHFLSACFRNADNEGDMAITTEYWSGLLTVLLDNTAVDKKMAQKTKRVLRKKEEKL